MNANNAKVQAVIESTFNSAIKKMTAKDTGMTYSDLYVQVDAESGELQIYDEEESLYPVRVLEAEGYGIYEDNKYDLIEFIKKGTNPDRTKRFQSLEEMKKALVEYLKEVK